MSSDSDSQVTANTTDTTQTLRPTAAVVRKIRDQPITGVPEIPSVTTALASILLPVRRDSAYDSSALTVSLLNLDYLLSRTRWIRDVLDPQIARQGPETTTADEVLQLEDLLRYLLAAKLSQNELRYSRLHLAVEAIASRATRWPKRLVDRCDVLKRAWEKQYDTPLKSWGTMLYEKDGGRLHGICEPEDTSDEDLLSKWATQPDAKPNPSFSRRHGDLGFVPGE
jgi:hypothetical protein